MPDYRIYAVGSDGRLIAVEDLDCADDQEAIKKATQAAKGSGIELREGGLVVMAGQYLEQVAALKMAREAAQPTRPADRPDNPDGCENCS